MAAEGARGAATWMGPSGSWGGAYHGAAWATRGRVSGGSQVASAANSVRTGAVRSFGRGEVLEVYFTGRETGASVGPKRRRRRLRIYSAQKVYIKGVGRAPAQRAKSPRRRSSEVCVGGVSQSWKLGCPAVNDGDIRDRRAMIRRGRAAARGASCMSRTRARGPCASGST